MASEISVVREKADLLKGSLNYREHYDYLMNWYLRDRKLEVPEPVMKESLRDVLEALKELNAKVESQAPRIRTRGSIFSRLCA